MRTRKKLIILAVLLILTIVNYTMISNSGGIRNVEFLSIFAIGAVSAIFICEIISAIKNG